MPDFQFSEDGTKVSILCDDNMAYTLFLEDGKEANLSVLEGPGDEEAESGVGGVS